MSKAFNKDDESRAPLVVPARAPLPAGVTNYVTPRGLELLRDEMRALEAERAGLALAASGAATAGDVDDDARNRLAVVGARIGELGDRIATAVTVEPSAQPPDEVHLGATVRVRDEAGGERRYRIVGVDEADAEHGAIAFVAPLARALLGKQVGDVATVHTPRGEDELEIVAIEY